MYQKNLPEYFEEHKRELTGLDQRSSFLNRVAEKYDMAHITYFCIPEKLEIAPKANLITTYCEDWQRHYFASGYVEIDPVLRDGMNGFLPFDWSNIHTQDKFEKRFFGEAKEFGIYDFGLTVPIRGMDGNIALLSINSNLSKKEWECYKHHNVSDILHFAHLFHDIVSDNTDDHEKRVRLSRREKQVLLWAGKGKTCWETAKILGLTERTVDFYLRNAVHKLGAATKTQAVANAIAGKHIIYTVDP